MNHLHLLLLAIATVLGDGSTDPHRHVNEDPIIREASPRRPQESINDGSLAEERRIHVSEVDVSSFIS
jgi:hypothetical protein